MDLVVLSINSDEAKRREFSSFRIQFSHICIEDTTLLKIHSLVLSFTSFPGITTCLGRKSPFSLSFPVGHSGDTVNSSPCPTLVHRFSLLSTVPSPWFHFHSWLCGFSIPLPVFTTIGSPNKFLFVDSFISQFTTEETR